MMRNIKRKYSVVIPLYNKADTINRTIDSIIRQGHDVEIIIVDDGSTDLGPALIKKRGDSRIILVQQQNHGVSRARNVGIEMSSCELIALIDADDQWESGFLDTIDSLVSAYPSAGAYATSYEIIDDEGIRKISNPKIDNLFFGLSNYFDWAQSAQFICSSSIVVKKKVVKELGGFREDLWYAEDVDLWSRLALSYSIAYSNQILATVDHAGNNHAVFRQYPANYSFVDSVNDYLSNHPNEQNEDILAYTNYSIYQVALRNIWWGYPAEARSLISRRPSNHYLGRIFICYIFSLVPLKLATLLRNVIFKITLNKPFIKVNE